VTIDELGGTFGARTVIDPTKLAEWLRSPSGPVVRELLVAGDLVKAKAKTLVGIDTGKLRDSIVKRMTQTPKGPETLVGSPAEYALWHHEGTDPHVIRAKKPGGVLTFMWKGKRVFFASVRHPGTKPNHFLTDALDVLRARYGLR